MIVTVTANPALDVTYGLDRLVPNHAHRVRSVHQRAGGKGVNVARVARRLGHETRVVTAVGGATGALVRADLDDAELPCDLVEIAGESRRTVTLVSGEDGQATLLNEPGPEVRSQEWAELSELVRRVGAAASAVVFAGSLPPGVANSEYARLVALLAERGVPTVLDTSGEALRAGVTAGPDIVKPNVEELAELTSTADPVEGATALREMGARDVVVSLGGEGLLAVTGAGSWRARPSRTISGNPTGAGDAVVAALAAGLRNGTRWPDRLREAVAVSTSAVATPVAGDIDESHYRGELRAARVSTVDGQEESHGIGSHG
ncbi:1-phosphofructokinase family hexose kinase [Actinopolyspora halophila]|uniref:1-phosphofructokinase family hexose kinase n=1 Tax=Actinopolyspora halophila TaxID=1850 RepID=UPI0003793946|nr:1-phosphofructokinase family hexose kinase [Actinopolyspora halophila]